MAGKRGKTAAGLKAESRKFEYSRMETYGVASNGKPKWRRLWLVPCIACGRKFETRGGLADGVDPKAFAYSLNWRCESCRDPRAVEWGQKRFAAMKKTLDAKRNAVRARALGVSDLV